MALPVVRFSNIMQPLMVALSVHGINTKFLKIV